MKEQWLVEFVEHVDNDIVVARAVYIRTWELTVNEDNLFGGAQGGEGSVGDIPCEEQIRILSSSEHHRDGDQ